jgi:flagellar hook protein FlgE
MGDLTFTVDEDAFKDTLEAGFQSVSIGNIGPGAGVPTKLAHIASVKFTNPDGLSQEGQGYFVGTINSGEPVATVPGNSGTGTFRAGALEMSNVDLSREFTEMIITQRGFQANTRMITVSDEMLSELISMKR